MLGFPPLFVHPLGPRQRRRRFRFATAPSGNKVPPGSPTLVPPISRLQVDGAALGSAARTGRRDGGDDDDDDHSRWRRVKGQGDLNFVIGMKLVSAEVPGDIEAKCRGAKLPAITSPAPMTAVPPVPISIAMLASRSVSRCERRTARAAPKRKPPKKSTKAPNTDRAPAEPSAWTATDIIGWDYT
ncbi:hypothetical protein PBRA_003060 [Plasmodiophora brassicae]|uniref:Uncharacterized protein n=1 Tax=Plasmodiophora brassicae TaxID=37360 RepID=A0A0G4J6V8_PLABS|nr:hypothetical protein PBRA_003060 [Plasmodiophora brassicae]